IRLGCNRILIELYCPDLGEESMWLAFEEQAGWLVAGVYRRGWSDALSSPRRQTVANALAGFYKMAGVDLVRDQIESQLPATSPGYEITEDALLVWLDRDGRPRDIALGNWLPLESPEPQHAFLSGQLDRRQWVF